MSSNFDKRGLRCSGRAEGFISEPFGDSKRRQEKSFCWSRNEPFSPSEGSTGEPLRGPKGPLVNPSPSPVVIPFYRRSTYQDGDVLTVGVREGGRSERRPRPGQRRHRPAPDPNIQSTGKRDRPMGAVLKFARPEPDAEDWQPYAGIRDGKQVVFALFKPERNAELLAGDTEAAPELHVTLSPAAARHWAETLLVASAAIEAPESLPEDDNARILRLLDLPIKLIGR